MRETYTVKVLIENDEHRKDLLRYIVSRYVVIGTKEDSVWDGGEEEELIKRLRDEYLDEE